MNRKLQSLFVVLFLTGTVASAQSLDSRVRGIFIATGQSEDAIPSEAELKMQDQARLKCDTVLGPIQMGPTVFRNFQGILYASAKFDCQESALDHRKCAYPDDSNPDCFKK